MTKKIKKTDKDLKFSKPTKVTKKARPPKVELVTFTMRATIPTAMYANLLPEITVKAKTLDKAVAFVMPTIEDLIKKYQEDPRDGRPAKMFRQDFPLPDPKVEVIDLSKTVGTPATAPTIPVKAPVTGAPTAPTPLHTPVYEKAKSAVVNAMSIEALEMIKNQIGVSVKLTDTEKKALLEAVVPAREVELNNK